MVGSIPPRAKGWCVFPVLWRTRDLTHEDQHEKQQVKATQADRIPLSHEDPRRTGHHSPPPSHRPPPIAQELGHDLSPIGSTGPQSRAAAPCPSKTH